MSTETEAGTTSTRDRLAGGDRVLSLSEVATLLHMKRPNVAKFLARRGVDPAFPKAQGYFWWASDIDRVKRERESDTRRMAADAQRRDSAVARLGGEVERPAVPVEVPRLGATQRGVLVEMLRRPVVPTDEVRFALRRLAQRGLVERVSGERLFQLTAEGRRVAAEVES